MLYFAQKKRFGYLAIEKGFITENQFYQAMKVQISREHKGEQHILIGEILVEMGFMTIEQIEEIIECVLEQERFKCPNCGSLLRECPNCKTNLMEYQDLIVWEED